MENVGPPGISRGIEVRRFVHHLVAGENFASGFTYGLFQPPAQVLAVVAAGAAPEHQPLAEAWLLVRQRVTRGAISGPALQQRDDAVFQEGIGRDIDAPVSHADVGAVFRELMINAVVVRGLHAVCLRNIKLVRHHPQVHVEDHAKEPVAAKGQREELRVLRAAAPLNRTGGRHDAERFHRAGDRRRVVLPAVAIHRERAADGKIVVRLHNRDGETAMIQVGDPAF